MILDIPKDPDTLTLPISQLWNGKPCEDDRLHAEVRISQVAEGIRVQAEMPILHDQKIPDAQKGTRVAGLWNYDVVEVFLVGPGHRYLEIELGAGGHWLVLGFDRIRHREDAHELFQPLFRYEKTVKKTWISQILIPWKMVPENVRALNAFAIAAGQFLAYAPVPGGKPDFHQPDHYPTARLV